MDDVQRDVGPRFGIGLTVGYVIGVVWAILIYNSLEGEGLLLSIVAALVLGAVFGTIIEAIMPGSLTLRERWVLMVIMVITFSVWAVSFLASMLGPWIL